MCGIVSYVGQRNATGVIVSGLQRLEYRGYDSAGVALYSSRRKTLARALSSPVIAIATAGNDEVNRYCNDVIRVPRCLDFLAPIPVVIVEQLLAYHVAKCRGCPIDQPRNLAKSVTVE